MARQLDDSVLFLLAKKKLASLSTARLVALRPPIWDFNFAICMKLTTVSIDNSKPNDLLEQFTGSLLVVS